MAEPGAQDDTARYPANFGFKTPGGAAQFGSFDMMMAPEAANMPSAPWQTEILQPGIWAGAMPRIWRTLSCSAYMPERDGQRTFI